MRFKTVFGDERLAARLAERLAPFEELFSAGASVWRKRDANGGSRIYICLAGEVDVSRQLWEELRKLGAVCPQAKVLDERAVLSGCISLPDKFLNSDV